MDRDVIAVFRDVADRSPAEREDYYSRCGVPAALRAEVESLLQFDGATLDTAHARVAAAAYALLQHGAHSTSAPPGTRGTDVHVAPALLDGTVFGPYRIVRHPLYFGWALAVFGAAHMTGDRLAFATITVAYLIAAISLEERSLTAVFGPEYENYARHVRWRMFPYVY